MKKSPITSFFWYCAITILQVPLFQSVNAQTLINLDMMETIWEAPDSVIAVPVIEVSSEITVSTNIIKEIRKELPDSSVIKSIEGHLEAIDISLRLLTEMHTLEEIDALNPRVLDDFKRQLSQVKVSMDDLLENLRTASRKIGKNWERTNFLLNTWNFTSETADEKEFPDAVKQRIDQIITDIDLLSLEVKEHLDAILAYETVLDLLSTTVTAYLEQCGHSFEKSHKLAFLQTHPPVWVSFDNEESEVTFWYQIKTISKEIVKGITDLWINYKITIILHLFSLIFIFMIILAIRRIIRRWEEEESDNLFVKILSMPFSIAFLITTFMTFYLYPTATVYVNRFAGLLLIIPISRLAIGVLNKKFHWLIYALVIIYLMNWFISSLFLEVISIPRIYILLEILVSFLLISWWIRPQSPIFHSEHAKHGKYILFLAIPSLLVLFTAFITNLLGYVDFSFELASGIVRSLTLALMFYIIVVFLEGVFLFILKDRSGKRRSSVEEYGGKLERRISSIIRLVAIIYWLLFTLAFFYIKDEVLEGIKNFLNLKWIVGEMTISLKGILMFILVIFVTIWIIKFIKLVLEKEVFPRVKLSRGVPAIISLIVRYFIATMGFFLALAIVGVDLGKLTILAGAIGVGIGFGLQDLFNNLISGFILVFERPVHVGDVVKFANMEGHVKSIGIRSSTIRIWDGTEVIVPNGKIISNELINLTLSDQLMRLDLELGVAYGTDPHGVIDILTYTATMHPDVIKTPKPFAIFLGYGESAIKFKLFFWTSLIGERMRIRSEVTLAVSDAMKNAGIEIPYPQQDVHVKIIEKLDLPGKTKKYPKADKK